MKRRPSKEVINKAITVINDLAVFQASRFGSVPTSPDLVETMNFLKDIINPPHLKCVELDCGEEFGGHIPDLYSCPCCGSSSLIKNESGVK